MFYFINLKSLLHVGIFLLSQFIPAFLYNGFIVELILLENVLTAPRLKLDLQPIHLIPLLPVQLQLQFHCWEFYLTL